MDSHVVVSKIEQDKLVVTQANKLVEASYTMSLEEKRVVLLLVSLVRKDDLDFQTYRIPITDIRDYLGLSTNKLYDDIKRVADTLMSRVLHIPEDDGGWLKVGWVSSARYVPKGKKGTDIACLDLCFSPEIKPYLLELKAHFTNYMLRDVAGLRSFYSIRFYELLKSRRRLVSTTIDVAELRKMLKVEDKYHNHKDFRTRVIITAQTELAEKTDIAFDFAEARRGRKVTSITFRIRDNVPSKPPRSITGTVRASPPPAGDGRQPPLLPPTAADMERARLYAEAIAEGAQNGVRETTMRDLLASRDPRHVMENIELARRRYMRTKGKVDVNIAGLTVAAITGDYSAEDRAKQSAAEERRVARERGKIEVERREKIEDTQRRETNARLAALQPERLDALRTQFSIEVSAGKYGKIFAADFNMRGWSAAGASNYFRSFASAHIIT